MNHYGSYVRQSALSLLGNLDTGKLVELIKGSEGSVPKSDFDMFLESIQADEKEQNAPQAYFDDLGPDPTSGKVNIAKLEGTGHPISYVVGQGSAPRGVVPGQTGEGPQGVKMPMNIQGAPHSPIKKPKANTEKVDLSQRTVRDLMQPQPDAPSYESVGGATGYT